MLQIPGVSLTFKDFAFVLAAMLHVWPSPLPWQRSVAGKEEVVCHSCILY